MKSLARQLLPPWRRLIESKGKEMSDLLSELDEAEDEKAAIQKKVAEVDGRIRELQARKGKLVRGIGDQDQKLENLLKRKNKLENFIDKIVIESKYARDQLERQMEQVKNKIGGLNEVETVQPESLPESNNLRLKWLESLERKIEAEEKELECPVCLEVAASPTFIFLF